VTAEHESKQSSASKTKREEKRTSEWGAAIGPGKGASKSEALSGQNENDVGKQQGGKLERGEEQNLVSHATCRGGTQLNDANY